jgi:hypothetical protein
LIVGARRAVVTLQRSEAAVGDRLEQALLPDTRIDGTELIVIAVRHIGAAAFGFAVGALSIDARIEGAAHPVIALLVGLTAV